MTFTDKHPLKKGVELFYSYEHVIYVHNITM